VINAAAPRVRRDVALLVSGNVVGQALVVAATPIVSRLFAPTEVGRFGTFAALESIVVVVACLRFDQAIPLARDPGRARGLLRLALGSAVAVAALVLVVAVALPEGVWRAVGIEGIPWLPLLLALTVLADAAGQAFFVCAVRSRDLVAAARSRAILGGAQAGSQVAFGAAGAGAGGLVTGYLIGRLGAVAALLGGSRSTELGAAEGARSAARDVWRYPAWLMPAAVLNAAALQLPVVLVAGVYSSAGAGALVLAVRVAAAPMQLVGQSIGQVFASRLGTRSDLEEGDLRPAVRGAATRLGLLGAVVALPLVVAGPSLAGWVLGESWRGAGRCAQLLAPAYALQIMVSPLAAVLAARRRHAVQLVWDAARVVAIVAAVVVPALLGRSMFVSVGAYGAVLAASYGLLFALVWRTARPARLSAPHSPAAAGAAPG
jgi:O-antigen/teichoic acid export membrane protein